MARAECSFCNAESSHFKVYEDDLVMAFLEEKPSNPGHVVVAPREHYTILEQVPDSVVVRLFAIANKISTALFEVMGVQGTNIVVNNGVAAGQKIAHFGVHVVPRLANDGLGFQWEPKKVEEERMAEIEFRLKEQAKSSGAVEEKKIAAPEKKDVIEFNEDDYEMKQMLRIP